MAMISIRLILATATKIRKIDFMEQRLQLID